MGGGVLLHSTCHAGQSAALSLIEGHAREGFEPIGLRSRSRKEASGQQHFSLLLTPHATAAVGPGAVQLRSVGVVATALMSLYKSNALCPPVRP